MARWLDEVEACSIRVTTLEQYKAVFHNVISTFPLFQDVTLRELAPGYIQSFYNAEIKRGVSPETVWKYHTNIHKCLNYAMQMDIIDRNPADRVILPKKQYKAQDTVYSAEDIRRLMEFFQGDILETVIRLTATYGLRRSEVCGLRWESVDFEHGTISICHTAVNSRGGVIYADTTKTRSSCRTLPLTSAMAQYLRDVQQRQREEKRFLGAAYQDTGYVCVDPDGTLLTPNAVSIHYRRMIRKSGLPYIRFHGLRHPYVKPTTKIFSIFLRNVYAVFPAGHRDLLRQINSGAFCFFIPPRPLYLGGDGGVDLFQPGQLIVQLGLLCLERIRADLLQHEPLIERPLPLQAGFHLPAALLLLGKLNLQIPGVGDIVHIQNDLRLLGHDLIDHALQLRLVNPQSMAGGAIVHGGVLAGKIAAPYPGHGVAAASAEHLLPQGIEMGRFRSTFDAGQFILHFLKYLPADNSGMVVRELHPLAFLLQPDMMPAHLRHLPLPHDVGAGVPLVLQNAPDGGLMSDVTAPGDVITVASINHFVLSGGEDAPLK